MEFTLSATTDFINHSDEPNAAYFDTLEVWALTDISPGCTTPSTAGGTATLAEPGH